VMFRPYLSPLLEHGKLAIACIPKKSGISSSISCLGVKQCDNYMKVDSSRSQKGCKWASSNSTTVVCPSCLSVGNDARFRLDHPCVTSPEVVRGKMISLMDPVMNTIFDKWYAEFSPQQKCAFDRCKDRMAHNSLIFGPPGSGKTTLLRLIVLSLYRLEGTDRLIVATLNKRPSKNVGGMTIHSLLGLQKEDLDAIKPEEVVANLQKNHQLKLARIRSARFLLIDECQMLTGKAYENLSSILTLARLGTTQSPYVFGDLNVVLTGDYFQDINFNTTHTMLHFFDAPSITEGGFDVIYLHQIYR
jgi:DNA replication protein DnaC